MSTVSIYPYAKDDGPSRVFQILQQDFAHIPIMFEPGSQFNYSASMDILGFIIEKVSGLSLEDYFKTHIFDPLGLDLAASFHGNTLGENQLSLSRRNPDGTLSRMNTEVNILPREVNVFLGGAGLYGSQASYLAVLRNILQTLDGTATQPLLSLESAKSLFAETLSDSAQRSLDAFLVAAYGPDAQNNQFSNGLRVDTKDVPGKRKAGSGSWAGWAATLFWIDPSSGVAAIFASALAGGIADPQIHAVFSELESALYAGLEN